MWLSCTWGSGVCHTTLAKENFYSQREYRHIGSVITNCWSKEVLPSDFPGGPAVKRSPSTAGGVGSIPGGGTKIPHATGWSWKFKNFKRRLLSQKCSKTKTLMILFEPLKAAILETRSDSHILAMIWIYSFIFFVFTLNWVLVTDNWKNMNAFFLLKILWFILYFSVRYHLMNNLPF